MCKRSLVEVVCVGKSKKAQVLSNVLVDGPNNLWEAHRHSLCLPKEQNCFPVVNRYKSPLFMASVPFSSSPWSSTICCRSNAGLRSQHGWCTQLITPPSGEPAYPAGGCSQTSLLCFPSRCSHGAGTKGP